MGSIGEGQASLRGAAVGAEGEAEGEALKVNGLNLLIRSLLLFTRTGMWVS